MTNILSNTLAFIVALGVIIFVHEAGHLIVAKLFRMKVMTFSLGFGKRLWGFQRGETDYRVSLVPLGGYVALGGEDPSEVSDDPREFLNKPRWQRILVYLAGPAMNIILAVALMAGVLMVGIEVSSLPDIPAEIGSVAEGSPGEASGLLPGDRIVAVNGDGVRNWDDLQFAILTSPDTELQLEIDRAGRSMAVPLTPALVPKYEFGDAGIFPKVLPRIAQVMPDTPAMTAGFEAGDEIIGVDGRPLAKWQDFVEYVEAHAGVSIDVEVLRLGESTLIQVTPRDEDGKGKIGVRPGYYQRLGFVDAFRESVRFNYDIARQTFAVLGKIFTGQLAAKSALSGPIEIAALSGAAARSGMEYLVQLMGLISISIAILNLLPIPVLDGGQIAILLVESLRRRDLSLKVKERINQAGFLMIVALMVVVLFFDLVKNVPAGLIPGS